jgi:hypothetical protein
MPQLKNRIAPIDWQGEAAAFLGSVLAQFSGRGLVEATVDLGGRDEVVVLAAPT